MLRKTTGVYRIRCMNLEQELGDISEKQVLSGRKIQTGRQASILANGYLKSNISHSN
jgi:hypothetical protein